MVELHQVAKTYPGTPVVQALKPVNLRIEAGDHVAIVGPSGSGKSTLLNLLGLLDRPSEGHYLLAGRDVSALSERDRTAIRGRRIGFVFQQFHLLSHRTAAENVALALLYTGIPARHRIAAAHQALERVGLSHRLHALPTTLSGGERQRVAIARALVGAPDIVLCDEPTGNLDSHNAHAVLDLLENLNSDGVTLIVITHDPGVAERAHRQLQILDGAVSPADVPEARPTAGTLA
ncbi:ABC transporter ATP-binding protein [Streptacidiphilus sp. BW17]|uniref:ABC transporter ATP-binding protein n=1 Tax=Streptacidiphilus sp. BW17 TaxID=3156274 RepID=UPI003516C466